MISNASKQSAEPRIETLLVVDDDPKIHPLIDFHLEGVVEKILHAESPLVGLRMAQEHRPDVVLLDIDMPRMDGYAWCRALKSDEDTRDSGERGTSDRSRVGQWRNRLRDKAVHRSRLASTSPNGTPNEATR